MPLTGYGVLTGRVLESRSEGGTDSPHFQIRVRGGDTDFRVAVDPVARLYAFGEQWGPEKGRSDRIFGFSPGSGVHDIHRPAAFPGRRSRITSCGSSRPWSTT
ncbi:MAG: DUF2278 family protein [Pseudonocardiaceae bacterium]